MAVVVLSLVACSGPSLEPGYTANWAPDHCPRLAGPVPGTAIDWVSFVVVGGVQFVTDHDPATAVPAQDVGEVVATVDCEVSEVVVDPEFVPREGDAAYLPVGTEVHAVVGEDPAEVLTALSDGTWQRYAAADGG